MGKGRSNLNNRRMVLVDIENLVGNGFVSAAQISWARAALKVAAALRPADQVVVGSSSSDCLLTSGSSWTDQRYLCRHGHDGADLALLEVMTDEHLVERYAEVVLASGDGIFTDAVARLATAGTRAHVVARPDALSTRLRLAATKVTLLTEPPHFDLQDAA